MSEDIKCYLVLDCDVMTIKFQSCYKFECLQMKCIKGPGLKTENHGTELYIQNFTDWFSALWLNIPKLQDMGTFCMHSQMRLQP